MMPVMEEKETRDTTAVGRLGDTSSKVAGAPPQKAAVAAGASANLRTSTGVTSGAVADSRETPAEISFPEGLIGMPEARQFTIETSVDFDPLLRMRCLDRPEERAVSIPHRLDRHHGESNKCLVWRANSAYGYCNLVDSSSQWYVDL